MVVIVDYGAGNPGSVLNMIRYCGYEAIVSSDINLISQASKLILPGVGSFDVGMENLEKYGLIETMNNKVLSEEVPVLGICLGMHLMTKGSEEGTRSGLGWIDAYTRRFSVKDRGQLKIPHMGWNSLKVRQENTLFSDLSDDSRFYFVHSYYVECNDNRDILAETEYGKNFVSAFRRNNIYATQFHPEKSHRHGKQVMSRFLSID